MITRDTIEVGLSDGRALYLEATINALCDYEEELKRRGFDPVTELRRLETGAGATTALRTLIWAFARARHEGLTIAHVGDLMQSDGPALAAGVQRALSAGSPEADPDAEPDAEKPQPPSA
jgi:hypothetical protein